MAATENLQFFKEPRCEKEDLTRWGTNQLEQSQMLSGLHFLLSEEMYHCEKRRLRSDCADAQADLSLCCSHIMRDTLFRGPIKIYFSSPLTSDTIKHRDFLFLSCIFPVISLMLSTADGI